MLVSCLWLQPQVPHFRTRTRRYLDVKALPIPVSIILCSSLSTGIRGCRAGRLDLTRSGKNNGDGGVVNSIEAYSTRLVPGSKG